MAEEETMEIESEEEATDEASEEDTSEEPTETEESDEDEPTEFSDIAPPVKKIELEGKTMADFSFFTRRRLENKEGEVTGRATVAVPKGSTLAQVEYECPLCEESGYIETEFVRAKSKTFKFRCEHCNKVVRLPKLSKPPK